MFGTTICNRKKLFVHVPSWWSDYEKCRLLVGHTPSVFAYHSTLPICMERHRLPFCIAVVEHCVHALLSFFTSTIVEDPVECTHVF